MKKTIAIAALMVSANAFALAPPRGNNEVQCLLLNSILSEQIPWPLPISRTLFKKLRSIHDCIRG